MAPLRLAAFARAVEFQQAAESWLARSERESNLVITTMAAAARQEGSVHGWLVMSGEEPVLVLIQIPSQYLLVSRGEPGAAAWAADALQAELPGVSGPAAAAAAFAKRWSERTGCVAGLNREMTLFTTERIAFFRRPRGALRQARADEFDKLLRMSIEAARDMNLPGPEQNPTSIEAGLHRAIAEGRQFVWAAGDTIRAMASYVPARPAGGARIRWVYTPAEFRGHGYGTAVSGALAEWLLGSGQAWVSLFADNANPISTGMYRRLGFRPEYVHRTVRFERSLT
ncbi:MAG TPA: GNAT family N-acetyltransferase [Bryobacteraceae bacterium]|nr:GNAT family N-acetyltransferase [Bryobacteraceae bacterium]